MQFGQIHLQGISVLLIENGEAFWDDLYRRLLASRCVLFAVNSAKDAQRMLALVRFDLIICDHRLRDRDGIEFFREAEPSAAGTLKILVTRAGDVEPVSEALLAGIDDIAEKPLSVTPFIAQLCRRLCLAGCHPTRSRTNPSQLRVRANPA